MTGQFAGELKPDYVIPFKLDKKAAVAAWIITGKKKAQLITVRKQTAAKNYT